MIVGEGDLSKQFPAYLSCSSRKRAILSNRAIFIVPVIVEDGPAGSTTAAFERALSTLSLNEIRLTPTLHCRSIPIMGPNRRDFIKKALTGVLVILGFGFLIPGIKIVSPAGSRNKELVFFPLIPEDEVPRSGVKKSELAYVISGKERKARVFIVSTSEGLSVFSATCTHLGCLVNYKKEKHEFVCPCHGGRYDLTGRNIAGPPPDPLTRFPIKTQDGIIVVGIKV